MSYSADDKSKREREIKQAQLEAELQEIKSRISMASSPEEVARLQARLSGIAAEAHDFGITVSGLDAVSRDLGDKAVAFSNVGDIPQATHGSTTTENMNPDLSSMSMDELMEQFSLGLDDYEKYRAAKRAKLDSALKKLSDPKVVLSEDELAPALVDREEVGRRERNQENQRRMDEGFQRLHKDEIDFTKKIDAVEQNIAALRHKQRSTDDRKEQLRLHAKIKEKQAELGRLEELRQELDKTISSKKGMEEKEKPRIDRIRAEDQDRQALLQHQAQAVEDERKAAELRAHSDELDRTALADGPSDRRAGLEREAQEAAVAHKQKRTKAKAVTKIAALVRARQARKMLEEKKQAQLAASEQRSHAGEGTHEKISKWSKDLPHEPSKKLGDLHPDPTPSHARGASKGKSGGRES